MPSRFQTMKCAASDELATSTAWMLLEYSWPMRWNTRSAPVLSTRTETPGYFASKDLPIFSASGRSTEVYQTTLPSFLAASISCGVIALAGGAADMAFVEKAAPATSALEPISTSRREILDPIIDFPPCAVLVVSPLDLVILPVHGSGLAVNAAKQRRLAGYSRRRR